MDQNLLFAIPFLGFLYQLFTQWGKPYLLEERFARIATGTFIAFCAAKSFVCLTFIPDLPIGILVSGTVCTFMFTLTFFTIAHV